MGDYGGDDRATSVKHGHLQWHLVIGAVLLIAAVYAVSPPNDPGPNSATVIGVTTLQPSFGSYPGLRVPLPPELSGANRHAI